MSLSGMMHKESRNRPARLPEKRRHLLAMNVCTVLLLLSMTGVMLMPAQGPAWASDSEIRIADSRGDWGYPTPFRHYPRGPGYVRMSWVFDTLVWKDRTGFVPALAIELIASNLTVAGETVSDRDGEIIARQLSHIGIQVTLVNQEQTTTDSRVKNWDFDLAVSGHGGISLYYPVTLAAFNPAKGIEWFYTRGGISKGIPIPQNKLSLVR